MIKISTSLNIYVCLPELTPNILVPVQTLPRLVSDTFFRGL